MDILSAPKAINEYLDDFKSDMQSGNQRVFSGFKHYDELTHGFLNGTLTVIASRPSMGKSAFADTIALKLALEEKKSVLYYSIESNEKMMILRLIANISGVSISSLLTGDLDDEENKQVEQAIQNISQAPLYMDFTPAIDIDKVSYIDLQTRASGVKVDIIFIDYLQLITTRYDKATNREQEMGYITRQLKSLAKKLNIPIVIISQLSRGAEFRGGSKKPILEDLRDSGVIEDVADVICFLHRPEYYGMKVDEDNIPLPKGLTEVYIGKNRHGNVGKFNLLFDKDTCKFSDYDEEQCMPFETNSHCNTTTMGNPPF